MINTIKQDIEHIDVLANSFSTYDPFGGMAVYSPVVILIVLEPDEQTYEICKVGDIIGIQDVPNSMNVMLHERINFNVNNLTKGKLKVFAFHTVETETETLLFIGTHLITNFKTRSVFDMSERLFPEGGEEDDDLLQFV